MRARPWKNTSILIAGCGSIGKRHARILWSLGVRDIRVCDPVVEQREALRRETKITRAFATFEQGLESKPDAVFLCTPPKMHVPVAMQALRAGRHVFTEKPLSDSLEGVEELAALVKKTNKAFMVGLCFRYHEGLTRAKQYLDEGRIGRLVSIRCRMGEHLPSVRPDYRTLFTSQYSGAFDLTHEIDLACWFAGDRPVTHVKSLWGAFSDIGIKAPDLVEIIVQFGSDCLAGIHLDFFSNPRQRLTELLGTQGTITVEFASWNKCTISVFEQQHRRWKRETLTTDRDVMFLSEDREFLSAITQGTPIRSDLAQARRSLEIVCRAHQASAIFGSH